MAYTLIDLQTGLKELWAKIKEALSSKQDTLSSGDNISIKDNKVSCTIDTGSFVTTSTLDGYLPLTGGTLTGDLTCNQFLYVKDSVTVDHDFLCNQSSDLYSLHIQNDSTFDGPIVLNGIRVNATSSTFTSDGFNVSHTGESELNFKGLTLNCTDISSTINFESQAIVVFNSANSAIYMNGANSEISINGSNGYIKLPSGIKIY